eukprot:tig00021137_g19019.t1
MPPKRRGRKKKPESESEGSAYEEEEEKPESESEEEVEEEEAEDEPKPKGKRGKKMKEKKYNELDMPIVEIPKRAVLVEGENGQIIEMQKGIPDVVKILEDPITRVQVPETTALDAYYEDATFWSIHSKQFYDALPEERLRAIPRAFQSAQKSPPVCYRCLRLMYEIPSIPRKKGTAEAVAEATAKKEAAYADYAKKVDKANEWAKAQRPKNKYPPIKDKKPAQLPPVYPKNSWLCMQCYRFLDERGLLANLGLQRRKRGDTTAVSAQAQNQMAQTVLGGPKPKASKSAKDMAAAFGQSTIAPGSGQEKIRKQDIAAPDMSRIDEILRKSTEVRENIEKTKTGLQAARANGLEALEKVITEINETGRSVFILNKKNADGSTRYDIRQARQSRYWVLFNTHKRLGAAREFEVEAFRGSLAQVLSDAEFYKFIRFNLKEEDGKYKDDTFANAIIGIRVQGGVEVGPTDGCLHAHVLVTIDHISNLQVLWAKYDWVVVLKEKEPGTTTVYERLGEILAGKFAEAGRRLVEQLQQEAGQDAERILQNAELIDDLNRGRIGMGKDPPTILAELIPEENYGGRLQEYLTKTLPETQRRDLLKQWSHARNQNNTDNNTDGYLFSIFQTESAPRTIRASRRRPPRSEGWAAGAERARGAEGAGAAVN